MDPPATLAVALVLSNGAQIVPSVALANLDLTVQGNCTLQSNGVIQADGYGYNTSTKGPGYTSSGGRYGGSFGGEGGQGYSGYGGEVPCYGSILNPRVPGSASVYVPGGGVVLLTVTGTLDVEKNARISSDGSSNNQGAGSGGSVNIRAQSLTGGGIIRAHGGVGPGTYGDAGAGGRVAVRVTGGGDFSSYTGTLNVASDTTLSHNGAGGSTYTETAAQGTIAAL